jgi:exopolysaccharide production protein ExoQ
MGTSFALLVCIIGIVGLFFLDRDNSVRPSKALWLPVIWLWIVGSRPVSYWLGMETTSTDTLDASLNGSPADAAIFAALLAIGVMVLLHRRKKTSAYLAVSGPILIYFLYCLMSVAWSPFHDSAFKRWTKAVGDLVMVLIILTDGQPIAALRRLYSRVGFILFPFSILLIRYSDMGRAFDPDGNTANVGVTTNKNELGLIVFVISLGALWNVRTLLMHKDAPHRGRRLVAQSTLLVFGIAVLQMAHSATSVICFILGAGLMFVTSLDLIRKRPGRVLALTLGVVLVGGLGLLFGGGSAISESLGRGGGLTGRTDIWAASIASVGNPFIGTGFESFWNANATKVNHYLQLRGFRDFRNINSAHNGYLQIYLDLGLVGVSLLVLVLINGYRNACKAFQHNPEFGSLMLACVATGSFYSITEAGFRILTPSWIFLLLGAVGSSGAACGLLGGQVPPVTVSGGRATSRGLPARAWHVRHISLCQEIYRVEGCAEFADPAHKIPLMGDTNHLTPSGASLVVERLVDRGELQ